MANLTPNYNLKKPIGTEFFNIEDQNGNMDIIDAQLKNNADAISAIKAIKVKNITVEMGVVQGNSIYIDSDDLWHKASGLTSLRGTHYFDGNDAVSIGTVDIPPSLSVLAPDTGKPLYFDVSGSIAFSGVRYVGFVLNETKLFIDLTKKLINKNHIINGNFDIWQRNTISTSSGFQTADRVSNVFSGSSGTQSRQSFILGQTDVPNNPTHYLRNAVTTLASASNYYASVFPIESVKSLSNGNATVSFYAKADSAKNIAIELVQHFGTGVSPSADVTAIGAQKISLTTSWVKYTATVAIPSISGKTLGSNGDDCLKLIVWYDAGSDYDNRTDTLGQQSGTFDISQVKVESGSIATDFVDEPYCITFNKCSYRYYKIKNETGSNMYISQAITTGAGSAVCALQTLLPIKMANDIPTYSYSALSDLIILKPGVLNYIATSSSLSAQLVTWQVGSNPFSFRDNVLFVLNNNGYIDFDAELDGGI